MILLGEEAREFLNELSLKDYINKDISVKGGIFYEERRNVLIAFDTTGGETFVEEFDDIVEAAKYAKGKLARIKDGYKM